MTVRFVADEDLNRKIVSSLQRRTDSLDIVRVQDVGLRTADDPSVLEWAASEQRALLTHDIVTMPGFAYQRVEASLPMSSGQPWRCRWRLTNWPSSPRPVL